jgi:hypothetical protein
MTDERTEFRTTVEVRHHGVPMTSEQMANYLTAHVIKDVHPYIDSIEGVESDKIVETDKSADGFDAMGKPVPTFRLARGLEAVREMLPGTNTEQAMALTGRVANCLERDDPYGAMGVCQQYALDLTGAYRLIATLLTGEEAE